MAWSLTELVAPKRIDAAMMRLVTLADAKLVNAPVPLTLEVCSLYLISPLALHALPVELGHPGKNCGSWSEDNSQGDFNKVNGGVAE